MFKELRHQDDEYWVKRVCSGVSNKFGIPYQTAHQIFMFIYDSIDTGEDEEVDFS